MLTETQVYLRLRRFLPTAGWTILGGQPPGGTNVVPIIEIKDESHRAKGSTGSKKVDLIAYRSPYFLLLELKEARSGDDITKLREITGSERWRRAFVRALDERGKWPPGVAREDYIRSDRFLAKGLGYNAGGGTPPDDFLTFFVSESGVEVHAGSQVEASLARPL